VFQHHDGWRPWLGGALAACGLFGYLGYVALVTGRLDGWSRIRRRTATAVAVLVAAALASAWYGGYALTIWHYGI
jgi:hypothetical protein